MDAYRTTPLHLACRNAHLGVARLLIDASAEVNARNAAGATPLHEAALGGDARLARLLIALGANPAARDRRGRTPATVAKARENWQFQ
jgi:ankyrin repeat protein